MERNLLDPANDNAPSPWASLQVGDIALHVAGAVALIIWPLIWWPWGLVITMWESWLLRECAQRDSGHLLLALRSMPQWPLQKHLEWIVPGFATIAVIATWQFWR